MDKEFNISTFKHRIKEKVKFHEVDMMNVVNNAVYLNYFEDARVKYLQDLKAKYKLNDVMEKDSFFIIARNEINYLQPAIFDDELNVYTKIEWIKNTSFGFQHLIKNELSEQDIAVGSGIMVHIKLSTKEKQQLPISFIRAIQDYEDDILKMKE